MKLAVQNLGPIKEGKVDLIKSLTVFCGPNGTGKSYMSMLIHEYYHTCSRIIQQNILQNKDLQNLYNHINEKAMIGGSFEFEFNFKDLDLINNKIFTTLNEGRSLQAIYGLNNFQIDDFVKNLKIESLETENLSDILFKLEIKEREITIGGDYKILISKSPKSQTLKIKFSENIYSIEDLKNHIKVFPDLILHLILILLINNFNYNAEFIYPEKTGFNLISDFASFFQNRDNQKIDFLKPVPSHLYRSFFNILNDSLFKTKQIKNWKSIYYDLVIELEAVLVGGSIFYNEDGEINFKDNRSKKTFSYNQSSSLVKSLSTFFLFLKHQAIQNETIIIDEPEINLHPDKQVLFTRIIARLINAGLRFIISTHSDYILRELNNLICISYGDITKSFAKKKLNYNVDEYINRNDINVYYFYFKDGEQKSTIEELKIDEYGMAVPSINDEIDTTGYKINMLNSMISDIQEAENEIKEKNIDDDEKDKQIYNKVAENEQKYN